MPTATPVWVREKVLQGPGSVSFVQSGFNSGSHQLPAQGTLGASQSIQKRAVDGMLEQWS